ncbi:MAG: DNA-3-methyladenine glycosylase [Hyphomicrobiaceae bacterium]
MKVRSEPASGGMAQKLIRTESDIRDGVRVLRRRCSVMKAIHERSGDPPLRRYQADFAGLARIIVGQQLSIASASAIWARLERSLSTVSAERIARARPTALAAAGLSAAKIRTLKALADATRGVNPALRIDRLGGASDEDVRRALTAVHGVGPWTADIFVMFCLGRADAWAAGDLALQVGVARAFALGERVSADETLRIAERWRPWRGVAARLVWADYANLRRQQPADPANAGKETAAALRADGARRRATRSSQPRSE